jgi:hypothetical protein
MRGSLARFRWVGAGTALGALLVAAQSLQPHAPHPGDTSVFRELGPASGIGFHLENSPSPEHFLIETMTGGVALLDYDGDGLLDIFLVNGAAIRQEPGKPPRFDKSDPKYWNRLYRNLGNLKFQDVTLTAGVRGGGYGLGVTVGDYDNDGYPDLYVTNFGRNELYHNERNGTFREVRGDAGVAGGGFSTSAAFFDYDRDGRLDLLVTRYVDWSFDKNPYCGSPAQRDYCHPNHFRGCTNLLFHNNGDGTFTDVSDQTGIGHEPGKGLGIAIADFDRDGWPDVFVANDSVPEFLFHNRGGRTFEEIGVASASALTQNGTTFAGMGADMADYDNDGWPDIFVTALSLEGYVLFRNGQDGTFTDVSEAAGIRRSTFYLSGWGTKFLDYDNDGWKDLFVANGHVMRNISRTIRTLTYGQPLLLLKNEAGRFRDAGPEAGPVFRQPWPARGAAFGDLDNDGDTDVVVQVLGGAPLVLENTTGNRNHWLGLTLAGTRSNREGIGATVTATDSLGDRRHFYAGRSGSYLSANDPRVLVGLGNREPTRIEIRWPSGSIQRIDKPAVNRYLVIKELSDASLSEGR